VGMSVGENKGAAMAEMNVVPLIDILLVLLIIFMVITPLTPKGLETVLPRPNVDTLDPKITNPLTVVVQVAQGGRLKINNEILILTGWGRAWNRFLKTALRKWLSYRAITM
jgi:biopolymer transport protein ExbD